MPCFWSCLESETSRRSLGSLLAAGALAISMISPVQAEGELTSDAKAGGKRDARGTFTITNRTLEAARWPAPAPRPAPQPAAEQAPPVEREVNKEHCLSIEMLNETGARAAELAREYFLAELDELAHQFDLSTAEGWTLAAPKLDALAVKIFASAARVYDADLQRIMVGFAQDMQETASWVQARPHESAEKFRRGEPVFSRRF